MISSLREPLIAIVGATGTGKSKLAVELALRFNGEIINGDAMQMYKGLPVITNKIPEQERRGIPHHLLDFIDLHEPTWTVKNFVRECQKIIREIRSRGKLPILVGGTHYYVHGLLFREALVNGKKGEVGAVDDLAGDEGDEERNLGEKFPILAAPTPEIYSKLQEVDPMMASRWHPNDRRKISRSLEIFLQTGRKASDIYEEQRQTQAEEEADGEEFINGASESSGMRYSSLIFWLEAQDVALKDRLNIRVHDMIKNGLLEEAGFMADLDHETTARDPPLDKGKGIWVSIGYKELAAFLSASRTRDASEKELTSLRNAGIEAVQASTRQYAKRQNRYLRIRLAHALKDVGAEDRLFLLDCTDLDGWKTSIAAPSQTITKAFLTGGELPDPNSVSAFAKISLSSIAGPKEYHESFQARLCEVCDKTLMTNKEWQGHLTSRGHRKALQAQRKRSGNEARLPSGPVELNNSASCP